MNILRLRRWLKHYGIFGVLMVSVCLALHYVGRNRLKVFGLLAAGLPGTLALFLCYHRATSRGTAKVPRAAVAATTPTTPKPAAIRQEAEQEPEQSPDPLIWQVSETPVIQLSVRDKYGALGEYDAVFVVTGPHHEKTQKTVHAVGSEQQAVTFPDDFPHYIFDDGHFTWVCRVRGKVVVKGKFSYRWTRHDKMDIGEQLTVPREN